MRRGTDLDHGVEQTRRADDLLDHDPSAFWSSWSFGVAET